jgi:hypothetical protein
VIGGEVGTKIALGSAILGIFSTAIGTFATALAKQNT